MLIHLGSKRNRNLAKIFVLHEQLVPLQVLEKLSLKRERKHAVIGKHVDNFGEVAHLHLRLCKYKESTFKKRSFVSGSYVSFSRNISSFEALLKSVGVSVESECAKLTSAFRSSSVVNRFMLR